MSQYKALKKRAFLVRANRTQEKKENTMLKTKTNPLRRVLSIFLTAALTLTAAAAVAPIQASASTAAQLATQINSWSGGGNGNLWADDNGNTVIVYGTVGNTAPATQRLNVNIDTGVTVRWRADLTSTAGTGAVYITGAGEFVMETGSVTYNNANTSGFDRVGGSLRINGGTITQSSPGGNGSETMRLTGCVARMSGGTVSTTNASASDVVIATSGTALWITGGTIKAVDTGKSALMVYASSAVAYTAAAAFTGIKRTSGEALIAEVTATSPLPQANIGTATGITTMINGSPAASSKWVNNGSRADIEVAFSSGPLTIPLRWAIDGVSPSISISSHPAYNTYLDYGAITGSLSVTASATLGAPLSYQWFRSIEDSSLRGGTPVGTNSASFTIPTNLTVGTYYYFCEVSAPGASTFISNVARVYVSPVVTAAVSQSPNPLKIGVPGTITVTYAVAGASFSSISSAQYAVTNLPTGMTAAAAVRTDATTVTVAISGTPESLRATVSAATSIAWNQFYPATPSAVTVANTTLNISMAKGDGAAVSGPPSALSVGTNGFTLNTLTNAGTTGQAVQYAASLTSGLAGTALDGLSWQPGTLFSGLAEDTTYYVYARTAADSLYTAGPAQSAAIKTDPPIHFEVSSQGLANLYAGQAVSGSVLFTAISCPYAGTINPADFWVTGLPAGLSAGTAVRTDSYTVTVPVTGAPTIANASAVLLATPGTIPGNNLSDGTGSIDVTGAATAGPVLKTGVSANVTFTPGAKAYTGSELDCAAASVSGITAGPNPLWTYTYIPSGGGASLGTSGKPLTAGTYNATASYDDGYNTGAASGVFTVNPKELTVSAAIDDKPYDGLDTATFTDTPALVGIAPGDAVYLIPGYPTFSSVAMGNDIPVNCTAFGIYGPQAGNYTLTQPTLTANITPGFTPIDRTHYRLSTPDGDNGWFRADDCKIGVASGFQISLNGTDTGPWETGLTYTGETNASSVTLYIRNTYTLEISQPVTVSYKIDRTAPTGEIAIRSNGWTSFLNTITFGYFFKNTVDVTITAADAGSGVNTIKYVVPDTATALNPAQVRALEGWAEIESGEKFSLPANWKGVVYADITDTAGNGLTISSDGVVVYTDSAQDTQSIGFTKTSTTGVTASVTLNGNTIAKIMNGAATLQSGTDYTIEDGTITFKAAYLDSLAAGGYMLAIHYNPLGEAYIDDSDNDEPGMTTIALTVSKANQAALAVTDPGAKTYGDADFQLTATGGSSGGAVTYERVSGPGSVTNGGLVTITGAGSIVVKATMAGDGSYNLVTSGNLTITVHRAVPPVVWPAGLTTTYGQALSDIALNGFANTPAGTFTWTTPTDLAGNAGSQTHNMTFTPDDGTNYAAQTNDVSIAVSPAVISSAAISVMAPATGETPSTMAGGTGNFTVGSVSWTPGDNPFKGSTRYTAEVTLAADANYTFHGMTSATINGNDAAVSGNSGTSVTLSYQFCATLPAGQIKRENIWWRQLLHVITFGIFWKDFQQVTIVFESPGVTAEYCIGSKGMTAAQLADAAWAPYGAPFRFHPPLFSPKKVYARLTDGAGNTAIISK